jgi:excisionase family DNA binding protein
VSSKTNHKAEQRVAPIAVHVSEASRLSGLCITTVYALLKERRLESVRIGRRRLILVASLMKLLAPPEEAKPVTSSSKPKRGRGRPRKLPVQPPPTA